MGLINQYKQVAENEYITVYDGIKIIVQEQDNENLSPAEYEYFLNKSGFVDAMKGHYYEPSKNYFSFYLSVACQIEKLKSDCDYNLDFNICDIIININNQSNELDKVTELAKKTYWKRDYFMQVWNSIKAKYNYLHDDNEISSPPLKTEQPDEALHARTEATYLNIIAALLETVLKSPQEFKSQNSLIAYLANHYQGYNGLSESTLKTKFSEANKHLNQSN